MSGRNSSLRGTAIDLTAIFVDAAGDYVDPTNLRVSVYPPGSNPETGAPQNEAWVYNVTTTSPGSGPEAAEGRLVERISEGRYKFSFAIPEDAELGSAFDRWEGTVDQEDLDETFSFVIVGGGAIGTTQLYNNNIVYITLGSEIASVSGAVLGEEETYYFTTSYDPLYVSVRQVRLDIGPFISGIPDDTVNLAIFEASLEADQNNFQSTTSNPDYFLYAKSMYARTVAELTLLGAIRGDSTYSGKMSKKLGDLSVYRGGNLDGIQQEIRRLQEEVRQWGLTLRSGGEVAPGGSLKTKVGVKGSTAEDAIIVNRQWYPTSGIGGINSYPAANKINVRTSGRRGMRTYRNRDLYE